MQAQVERNTGTILAFGEFPAGSPDPDTIDIVDLAPAELVKLRQPGAKTLDDRGVIVVTPPPPDPPAGIEPTRDERLLMAVEQATEAVQSTSAFTTEQKSILTGVFTGLGDAISGD